MQEENITNTVFTTVGDFIQDGSNTIYNDMSKKQTNEL